MFVYKDAFHLWRELGTDKLLHPQPSEPLGHSRTEPQPKPLGVIPAPPHRCSLKDLPDIIYGPMRRIGQPIPIQVADVSDSLSNFVAGPGVTITHSTHGRQRVVIITANVPDDADAPAIVPSPSTCEQCGCPLLSETFFCDGCCRELARDI